MFYSFKLQSQYLQFKTFLQGNKTKNIKKKRHCFIKEAFTDLIHILKFSFYNLILKFNINENHSILNISLKNNLNNPKYEKLSDVSNGCIEERQKEPNRWVKYWRVPWLFSFNQIYSVFSWKVELSNLCYKKQTLEEFYKIQTEKMRAGQESREQNISCHP